MNKLRLVIVVSPDSSDQFFANQLIDRFNVVGVVIENQQEDRDNTPTLIKALKLLAQPSVFIKKTHDVLIGRYLRKNAIYNRPENSADFGPLGKCLITKGNYQKLYTKGVNEINAPNQVAWLKQMKPDIMAVCGASLMKKHVISIPKMGVLNLHGGLSQHYRGLFTTDWAIYNERPECIGATVHYISPGIDDGDILYQTRPNIEPNDNPNSLYVKIVHQGIDMMEQAIRDILAGTAKASPLIEKGDLCLGRMFTPRIKRITWEKVQRGVITDYLKNKSDRDKVILAGMINPYEKE